MKRVIPAHAYRATQRYYLLAAKHACNHCRTLELADKPFVTTESLEQMINRQLQAIFEGSIYAGMINPELWQFNVDELLKAFEEGYKKSFAKVVFGMQDFEYMQAVQANINTFAAFKNHQEVATIVRLLTDEQGNERSFAAFKKEALKVSKEYNVKHLEAEYNRAYRQAEMADKWKDIVQEQHLYPNLQYIAVMDDRTRDSHRALHGTIAPIGDMFWQAYYPPNGWGCRCTVRQTDKEPLLKQAPTIPDEFKTNVGTTPPFSKDHPYFKTYNKSAVDAFVKAQQNGKQ